jgi:hypothetical protein
MSSGHCPRLWTNRPLVVVTAVTDAQRGWVASHDRLVTLSTNAVHPVLDNATHDSAIAGEDSDASVNAILDVLAEIRDGTPLR